jgi:hypothetical protein
MNMVGHYFRENGRYGRNLKAPLPLDREVHSALIPDCVLDPEKYGEQIGVDRRISIRLVNSDSLRRSACDFINRRYDWRGYGSNHQLRDRQETTSFIALIDEEVVGTITLTVDSPVGLAADQIFRDEIDTIRHEPGSQVCELTKFAFETDISSKYLLAALFHVVFIYGQRRYQCTDLFIEVNPRHRRFYQTLLGFRPFGDLRTNQSVDAPSQLMTLKVEHICAMIQAYRVQSSGAQSRSLYPHFLSTAEEASVRARMMPESAALTSTWKETKVLDHVKTGVY